MNAKTNLDRTRQLVQDKVSSRQSLEDAVAKFDGQTAKVASLERTYVWPSSAHGTRKSTPREGKSSKPRVNWRTRRRNWTTP